MACGLPVVTNEGGISDYMNDRCGALLPIGDIKGMAGAALAFLVDDGRRRAAGRTAREHVQSFSWTKTAVMMNDIYRRLVGEA